MNIKALSSGLCHCEEPKGRRSNLFKLETYFYELPPKLIAQKPVSHRDQARLLVISRGRGTIIHDTFNHLEHYLPKNSDLVVNNSKVIPARLLSKRSSGGSVEIFLLRPLEDGYSFEALIRPLKKIKEGEKIELGLGINAELINKEDRIIRFNKKNIIPCLKKIGHIPLPPYIKRPDTAQDHIDYQTVYARQPGSVASPTAGLHFTDALITKLKKQGHRFLELTLHINYGTFKPVECEDIRLHGIHTEDYSIDPAVYKSLVIPESYNVIPAKGPHTGHSHMFAGIHKNKSVVAVGTTSCRVLETVAKTKLASGSTDIFIYPGFRFQMTDALITNFHLPYSTLLMLVCAFGGYDLVMKAYHEAIKEKYRFYSYGDAMLIL